MRIPKLRHELIYEGSNFFEDCSKDKSRFISETEGLEVYMRILLHLLK